MNPRENLKARVRLWQVLSRADVIDAAALWRLWRTIVELHHWECAAAGARPRGT